MRLMDILGPIMVGPSSSHTAGACRIGLVCRALFSQPIESALIQVHGSFLGTGKGHGTDRALVAGLLGISESDERLPFSFQLAQGVMDYTIEGIDLGEQVQPNSVRITMFNQDTKMCVQAASTGGGQIQVDMINGLAVHFTTELPTLVVQNEDKPGFVAKVTRVLEEYGVNVATFQLYRSFRGGYAMMSIECDQSLTQELLDKLRVMPGILSVAYVNIEEAA